MKRLSTTITVIALCAFCVVIGLPQSSSAQHDKDYETLFNKSNLDGWKMQWSGLWTVENGVLTGKQDPATGKDSWLFTTEEWDDFILYAEFKMTPNCNSGIGVRMPKDKVGRPSEFGFEIQISDNHKEYPTGSVFKHQAASQNLHSKDGNEMYIICVKDHIVVYVNKTKVVDTHLEGPQKGRIGLQVHGGEDLKDQVVQFRNIRIKDLKPQYQCEPSPIKFKNHQIGMEGSEGCAIADINRDGKLDITCGSYWYEAPEWNKHKLRDCGMSGEYTKNYGEWSMDVNSDGWADVVTGSWFSPDMVWYENPGDKDNGELWKEHIIGTGLNNTESIFLCDVDYDGRQDILVNRYDTTVPPCYYANVGFDKSETGFEKRIFGWEGRGHGMGFGDINSDGRNDVLTSSGWYECPLNPQTQDWTWHPDYMNHDSSIPQIVNDLNLDGLPDIIYGNGHNFGLYWLEQTMDSAGRSAWIFPHVIDDSYSQVHCPILTDLDGDGTKDIISGKRYRGHNGGDPGAMEPQCIFWYKVKKGPAPQFTRYIVTYDENIGMGMNSQAVDIDNDGDIDIIAPGKSGLFVIENLSK